MSNFLGIGGVSKTLRNLLRDRMQISATVTIGTPPSLSGSAQNSRVNLFLYRVEEHPNLKNQEIPGTGHPGTYGYPPLSLNLYYLVTAYGSNTSNSDSFLDETLSQQVLGSCMRVFHDYPIISEDLEAISGSVPVIIDPDIQNEFERIKITLEPITLDEISKIWSSFSTPLRASVAYRVSVIQIENRQVRRISRPVEKRRINMSTMKRPEITDLYRTPTPTIPSTDAHVPVTGGITIEGENFIAPRTWVKIGDLDLIGIISLSDKIINIPVPDDEYPIDPDHLTAREIPTEKRLFPGPHVVRVHISQVSESVEGGLDKGRVISANRIINSNAFVFMLVPEITSIDPVSGDSTNTMLTINGSRLFRDNTTSTVVIGDFPIEVKKPETGDPWSEPTDISIQIPLEEFITETEKRDVGEYKFLVRIMVNGVLSIPDITQPRPDPHPQTYTYTKT